MLEIKLAFLNLNRNLACATNFAKMSEISLVGMDPKRNKRCLQHEVGHTDSTQYPALLEDIDFALGMFDGNQTLFIEHHSFNVRYTELNNFGQR